MQQRFHSQIGCRAAPNWIQTWPGNGTRLATPKNNGGRGGIRTHGGFPHARFRVECLKPDSATLPLRKKERRTSSVQRKYHTGILSARRLRLLAATSPGLGLAWRVPSCAVSALAARLLGRTTPTTATIFGLPCLARSLHLVS